MPRYITNTEDIKILLELGNDKDTLLDKLIPIAAKKIIKYTNNNFVAKGTWAQSSKLVFAGTAGTITAEDTLDFAEKLFYNGDVIRISGSARNDNIYDLDESDGVAVNVLKVIQELKDEESGRTILIEKIEYPEDLVSDVAEFIKFFLNKHRDKTSFSLADYSVAFANTDLPDSLRRSLNQYRKPVY
jgi:hypothetical protein